MSYTAVNHTHLDWHLADTVYSWQRRHCVGLSLRQSRSAPRHHGVTPSTIHHRRRQNSRRALRASGTPRQTSPEMYWSRHSCIKHTHTTMLVHWGVRNSLIILYYTFMIHYYDDLLLLFTTTYVVKHAARLLTKYEH